MSLELEDGCLPDPGDARFRCEPTVSNKSEGCGGIFCVEGHNDTEPITSVGREGISVLLRCNKCGRWNHERFKFKTRRTKK